MLRKMIVTCLAIMIIGCSSSNNSLNDNIKNLKDDFSTLTVLVKDNFSLEYREVWIRLYRVEAIDDSDQVTSLYDNPDGRAFNLASTDAVAALLSTKDIPVANYKTLRITLASDVTLVDQNGDQKSIKFTNSSDTYTLSIPTDITTIKDQVSSLALDFDIAKFVIDQASEISHEINVITDTHPAIERIIAKIEGKIVSIINDHEFTFQPTAGNSVITVLLHASGVVTDEAAKLTSLNFSSLKVDDIVNIFGNYNSNKLTIEAVSVLVNGETPSNGSSSQVINKTVEVEGIITNLDNNSLELDVHEASFFPDTNSVTIIDLTNALYERGNYEMLAVDQKVEIKGTWDGQQLTAKLIEIEGAQAVDSSSGSSSGDQLAEVEGSVSQLQGTILTIQIDHVENITIIGNSLTLDIKDAWFKYGNIDCLVTGTEVELKGSVSTTNTNTLLPTVIEIKSNCITLPDEDLNGATNSSKAEGSIQTISDDKLTLQITETEGFSPTGSTIEVVISDSTVFEHGTKSDLVKDGIIEVYGAWNGQALIANKIEFYTDSNS